MCRNCGTPFEVTPDDLSFLDDVAPMFAEKKFPIPPPLLCPDCRRQRRLAFRNERHLYKRKSDLTGKEIVSAYSPDKPFKVCHSDEWWSDRFDPLAYGKKFDFSRPFFEQFYELKLQVPHMALITSPDAEANNCQYINFAGHSKNCYMTFDSDYNEDALYSNVLKFSKSCIDCSHSTKAELCYEDVSVGRCYNVRYSCDLMNCQDCMFVKACIGCRNCFLCCNVAQKEYHIRNKPYSKEEYMREIASYGLEKYSNVERFRKEFSAYVQQFPEKALLSLKDENCSGDYLYNVKNCFRCFSVTESEDMRYCDCVYRAGSCMDVSSFGEHIERVYESGTIGIECYGILFSFGCVINCSDLLYCEEMRHSKNCFGSVSLEGCQYCILNKQYTKEEYEQLVSKIIEHMKATAEWGEYFPIEHSAFCYNETIAQEYFPLTREVALSKGYRWKDEDLKGVRPQTFSIPDSINEVPDAILGEILVCSECGRNYKIISQELVFYRQQRIPIPRRCPDCRHARRMKLRRPRKLWERTCDKCKKSTSSSIAPERKEQVYCHECFLKELY